MKLGPISITWHRKPQPRALIVTRANSKAQREYEEARKAINLKLAAENARHMPGRVG